VTEPTARGKILRSAADALAYQRAWFQELRAAADRAEHVALVNADCPHELLRAMDIPYVVNQWWASVVAAKQQTNRYLASLDALGYPDFSEQYSAVSVASALEVDRSQAPWGGLPMPFVTIGELASDAGGKVFDVLEEEAGVRHFPLETTVANTAVWNWWELMPERWEDAIGRERIELMAADLRALTIFLEDLTGRPLSIARLGDVMRLANEQAEWNRKTRDLIAAAPRCPARIDDSIPAVMIPQWHRGTEWARDAARRLYFEVEEEVSRGAAVCAGETRRLMWIGRGLWFDMDLYRAFEDSHGAVFVWSMYLAVAADGYLRYGPDPMRALAARFAAFSDQLYMPPWSSEWYLKEARLHGVQGVVHLVSDDARGSWFTANALEGAGIPVFELKADNVDARSYDPHLVRSQLREWLDDRVVPATGR
jgi:hypothetical protein